MTEMNLDHTTTVSTNKSVEVVLISSSTVVASNSDTDTVKTPEGISHKRKHVRQAIPSGVLEIFVKKQEEFAKKAESIIHSHPQLQSSFRTERSKEDGDFPGLSTKSSSVNIRETMNELIYYAEALCLKPLVGLSLRPVEEDMRALQEWQENRYEGDLDNLSLVCRDAIEDTFMEESISEIVDIETVERTIRMIDDSSSAVELGFEGNIDDILMDGLVEASEENAGGCEIEALPDGILSAEVTTTTSDGSIASQAETQILITSIDAKEEDKIFNSELDETTEPVIPLETETEISGKISGIPDGSHFRDVDKPIDELLGQRECAVDSAELQPSKEVVVADNKEIEVSEDIRGTKREDFVELTAPSPESICKDEKVNIDSEAPETDDATPFSIEDHIDGFLKEIDDTGDEIVDKVVETIEALILEEEFKLRFELIICELLELYGAEEVLKMAANIKSEVLGERELTKLMSKARDLFVKGKYSECLTIVSTIDSDAHVQFEISLIEAQCLLRLACNTEAKEILLQQEKLARESDQTSSLLRRVLMYLGDVSRYEGAFTSAQQYYTEAVEQSRSKNDDDIMCAARDDMMSIVKLAGFLVERCNYALAETYLKQLIDSPIATEAPMEQQRSSISTMRVRAELMLSLGKFDDAIDLLEDCLVKLRAIFREGHPETASILNLLGHANILSCNLVKAEILVDGGLVMRRKFFNDAHPAVAASLLTKGVFLHSFGRSDEALRVLQSALDIYQDNGFSSGSGFLKCFYWLEEVRQASGHTGIDGVTDSREPIQETVVQKLMKMNRLSLSSELVQRVEQVAEYTSNACFVGVVDSIVHAALDIASFDDTEIGAATAIKLVPAEDLEIPNGDWGLTEEHEPGSAAQDSVTPNADVDCLMTEARHLYTIGKYAEALSTIRQADAIIPQADTLRVAASSLLQAQCLLPLGEAQKAKDILTDLQGVIDQRRASRSLAGTTYLHETTLLPSTLIALGDVSMFFADYSQAEKCYKQVLYLHEGPEAVTSFQALPSENDGEDFRVIALSRIAASCVESGDYKRVSALLVEFDESCKKLSGAISDSQALLIWPVRARFHYVRGNYIDAEKYFTRCLDKLTVDFPEGHPAIADTICECGALRAILGDYESAEAMVDKSMTMRRKFFSPNHVSIAQSMCVKARLCRILGLFGEALTLVEKALEIYEPVYHDHQILWRTLLMLGDIKHSAGRFRDAHDNFQAAFEGLSLYHGEETAHVDIADCLLAMGTNFFLRGDYSASQSYLTRAFEMRKILVQNMGQEDHVDLNINTIWLGRINSVYYRFTGEGKQLILNSIKKLSQYLRKRHCMVAFGLQVLAEFMSSQGRYADAEKVFILSLEMVRHTLGQMHLDVVRVLTPYAENMRRMGEFERARALSSEACALSGKSLWFFLAVHVHAKTLEDMGDTTKAERSCTSLLKSLKKYLGESSAQFAVLAGDAGEILMRNKRLTASAKCLTTALELRKKSFGDDHYYVYETMTHLALLAIESGDLVKCQEAIKELQRILPEVVRILGANHPFAAYIRANIGLCSNTIFSKCNEIEATLAASLRSLSTEDGSPFSPSKFRPSRPRSSLPGDSIMDEAVQCWDENTQLRFADNHPWLVRFGVVPSSAREGSATVEQEIGGNYTP